MLQILNSLLTFKLVQFLYIYIYIYEVTPQDVETYRFK